MNPSLSLRYKSWGGTKVPVLIRFLPMFELLYAINVVFKTFGLPGLCAFSMAIEWRMARLLSLRMADDMGHDKISATALKNSQSIPGTYMDEVLLRCITPRLHSPSVHKLSLPGSRTSIMPYIEICASPIEDDGGVPLVQGSLEHPQNDDTTGYMSDNDVRFSSWFLGDVYMLTPLLRIFRTQIPHLNLT